MKANMRAADLHNFHEALKTEITHTDQTVKERELQDESGKHERVFPVSEL